MKISVRRKLFQEALQISRIRFPGRSYNSSTFPVFPRVEDTLGKYRENKPVGDGISVPSPNFVAMATRVGPTFCTVPLNQPSLKTPK